MRQDSFSEGGFEKYRKKARKEQFLEELETIIPWQELCEAIEPFYPKPQGAGRRPVSIVRMLRINFLQHWFNLSDSAAEEALYDSQALRQFVGIDLGREPAPDETTICNFRHLMEKHNPGDQLFHLVNQYLQENGVLGTSPPQITLRPETQAWQCFQEYPTFPVSQIHRSAGLKSPPY